MESRRKYVPKWSSSVIFQTDSPSSSPSSNTTMMTNSSTFMKHDASGSSNVDDVIVEGNTTLKSSTTWSSKEEKQESMLNNSKEGNGIPEWQLRKDVELKPFGMSIPSSSSTTSQIIPSPPSSLPQENSPKLRKELIDKTIEFLKSPSINGTSIQSQKEFLLKKGITEEEYEYAIQVYNQSLLSNIQGDGIPKRPGYTKERMIINFNPFKHDPNIKIPKKRHGLKYFLIYVIWTSGISSCIFFIIRYILIKTRNVYDVLFSGYFNKRRSLMGEYLMRILDVMKLYKPIKQTKDGDEYITDEIFGKNGVEKIQSKILDCLNNDLIIEDVSNDDVIDDKFNSNQDLLSSKITSLTTNLNSYKDYINDKLDTNGTFSQLKEMADSTSQLLTNETYFNSSSLYSRASYLYNSSDGPKEEWLKTLNDIKADVRNVKGSLLSRRNFPGGVVFTTPKINGSMVLNKDKREDDVVVIVGGEDKIENSNGRIVELPNDETQ